MLKKAMPRKYGAGQELALVPNVSRLTSDTQVLRTMEALLSRPMRKGRQRLQYFSLTPFQLQPSE